MKIVIVDDEPIICNGLRTIITNAHDPDLSVIKTYTNAEEALELCNWNTTDLLIADISMPGMTGFELIGKLKERGYQFWVIMISAFTDFEYARQAIQGDVVDYIVKPIVPDNLFAALEKAKHKFNSKKQLENSKAFIEEHQDFITYSFFEDLIFGTENNFINQDSITFLELDEKQFILQEVLFLEGGPSKNICSQIEHVKVFFFPSGNNLYTLLAVSSMTNARAQTQLPTILPSSSLVSDMATTTNLHELPIIQKTLMKMFGVKLRKLNISNMPNDRNLRKITQLQTAKQNYNVLVQKAMDIVDKEYAIPLSLTIISDQIHVHPTYLSNLFSKQTGLSLIDYINRVRVIKAQIILQDLDSRICMVSQQVGFSDQRRFGQVFKKVTGLTPLQYKNTYYMTHVENDGAEET